MSASGTVSTRVVVINEESGFLGQFTDVVITSPGHDQAIKFDAASSSWVNSEVTLDDLADLNLASVSHNDVLIWNAASSRWDNGKITSLLSALGGVVDGIVSIKLSVFVGERGDSARAVSVAFTDDVEGGFTMAIGSCGDDNAVYKKSPSETAFSFLTTLDKGQNLGLTLEAGTVFRSTKGLAGFSCPFPMPFGISNFSDTYFRFYALRFDNVVHATSAGRDSLVTLLASDETTVVDGPNFISAYGTTVLSCNANAEFVVVATTDIFCGTKGDRGETNNNNRFIDMRLVPPMSTELIVHSRNNRLSARFADTTVVYYRRNMSTGSFTVQGGTPLAIGAATGNQTDYANDGWLILRADKPTTSFSGADSQGYMATSCWPLTALAQLFPIVSSIGANTDFGRSSISLASPFEGTARVYDENKVLLDTFTITRGTTPPATPADQDYPAAGQWNPQVSLGTTIDSGFVECSVPCVCVCNFEGSSVFGDLGDEMAVPGSTPDEIRALVRRDPDGFLRRRDVGVDGTETWNIC